MFKYIYIGIYMYIYVDYYTHNSEDILMSVLGNMIFVQLSIDYCHLVYDILNNWMTLTLLTDNNIVACP